MIIENIAQFISVQLHKGVTPSHYFGKLWAAFRRLENQMA
jgi:hypothetical protein